jgi:uncharacterized protein
MDFSGFDWDQGNRQKCEQHGLSIVEIEKMFRQIVFVAPDPLHSASEERFKAIGESAEGRKIFVVFTWRIREGDRFLRPISARYMHDKEIGAYEKEASDSDKRH